MEQQQRRNVLFVCGFNPTASSWNPHYAAVRAYLGSMPGVRVEYYTYMSTERPESVYAGLCVALRKVKYDTIVGHGLGCTLVAQYLTNHPKALASFAAVVMCMPLITTDNKFHATALSVPFFEFVPIPLMLFDALYDENFWTYERYAESVDDVRKKIGCNKDPFGKLDGPFARCAEKGRREQVSETESDSDSGSELEREPRRSPGAEWTPKCGGEPREPRDANDADDADDADERKRACCVPRASVRRERKRPCERKRERERPCEQDLPSTRDALRDALAVFNTQQFKFAYTTWIPDLDLRFLGAPNVHVIYATEDTMAPIDPCTLARVRNLRCITGTHAAFNACRSARAFFSALGAAMSAAVAPIAPTGGPIPKTR
jgi:pimeloyl-ACP methyl ester carboxylesterase